jgi:hypothetical protein
MHYGMADACRDLGVEPWKLDDTLGGVTFGKIDYRRRRRQ